jgi:hypothetical protein
MMAWLTRLNADADALVAAAASLFATGDRGGVDCRLLIAGVVEAASSEQRRGVYKCPG